MSVKVSGKVWDTDFGNVTDKMVALALADKAEHDGTEARPSVGLISHMTGLDRSTVIEAVKRLQSYGVLKCTKAVPGKKKEYAFDLVMLGEGIVYERIISRRSTSRANRPVGQTDQSGRTTTTSRAAQGVPVGLPNDYIYKEIPVLNPSRDPSVVDEQAPLETSSGEETRMALALEIVVLLQEIPAVQRSGRGTFDMQVKSVNRFIVGQEEKRDDTWWRNWAISMANNLAIRLPKKYGFESVHAMGAAKVLEDEWSRRPTESIVAKKINGSPIEQLLVRKFGEWDAAGIGGCRAGVQQVDAYADELQKAGVPKWAEQKKMTPDDIGQFWDTLMKGFNGGKPLKWVPTAYELADFTARYISPIKDSKLLDTGDEEMRRRNLERYGVESPTLSQVKEFMQSRFGQ